LLVKSPRLLMPFVLWLLHRMQNNANRRPKKGMVYPEVDPFRKNLQEIIVQYLLGPLYDSRAKYFGVPDDLVEVAPELA
jgi:hypothetical protein